MHGLNFDNLLSHTQPVVDRQQMNVALSLVEMGPLSALYIPLTSRASGFPSNMSVLAQSSWHLSALQATAFESLTLPSRLRASSATATYSSLDSMTAALERGHNRRIVEASFAVGALEESMPATGASYCNLFPDRDKEGQNKVVEYARLVVERGARREKLAEEDRDEQGPAVER